MNDYRAYAECDYNAIYHHGVKGQKWGQRRYQNEDGSLTPQGMARYRKYRDAYMRAGYSKKVASELAMRREKNKERTLKRTSTAAATAAGLYGINTMAKAADSLHAVQKSYKRGTIKNDWADYTNYMNMGGKKPFGMYMRGKVSKAKKATNAARKGFGFTEKYVKGHTVGKDGVLNPIMKTRLTKKGKIGLAVAAGAAALGAGGYALYKHNKKKKQKQKQKNS